MWSFGVSRRGGAEWLEGWTLKSEPSQQHAVLMVSPGASDSASPSVSPPAPGQDQDEQSSSMQLGAWLMGQPAKPPAVP